ncbi:MAG: hypothetical protein Q8O92_05700, partial [Candidatus Latescibacter sp.]|nr:hypothetical protein [Candidatus Latescibacter sp.]
VSKIMMFSPLSNYQNIFSKGALNQKNTNRCVYCCSSCGNVGKRETFFQVTVGKSKTFQWLRHIHSFLIFS